MATITGQRASSPLPARDTPRIEDRRPDTAEAISRAAAAAAAAAWRSVVPALARTPHVRISRDGGRTYPARYARPLPAEPPGQPCTIPVFHPASATGRMPVLDLDVSRAARAADGPAVGQCHEHGAVEVLRQVEALGEYRHAWSRGDARLIRYRSRFAMRRSGAVRAGRAGEPATARGACYRPGRRGEGRPARHRAFTVRAGKDAGCHLSSSNRRRISPVT